MRTGKQGIELIKQFEGLVLHAYKCPAGVLTIGYGHTGRDVTNNMTITPERAEHLLRKDLKRFEDVVNNQVCVNINQSQFDALVSLTFNIGCAAFKASTLLRNLNKGDYEGASNEFMKWIYANKRVLDGLVRRRQAEQELFNE